MPRDEDRRMWCEPSGDRWNTCLAGPSTQPAVWNKTSPCKECQSSAGGSQEKYNDVQCSNAHFDDWCHSGRSLCNTAKGLANRWEKRESREADCDQKTASMLRRSETPEQKAGSSQGRVLQGLSRQTQSSGSPCPRIVCMLVIWPWSPTRTACESVPWAGRKPTSLPTRMGASAVTTEEAIIWRSSIERLVERLLCSPPRGLGQTQNAKEEGEGGDLCRVEGGSEVTWRGQEGLGARGRTVVSSFARPYFPHVAAAAASSEWHVVPQVWLLVPDSFLKSSTNLIFVQQWMGMDRPRPHIFYGQHECLNFGSPITWG